MSLSIRNVSKLFGNHIAVNNFSLELPKGEVLGLLGRNGAGKSTTLKILLQLIQPSSGEILWDDKPINRNELSIGYLPEERGLYPKIKIIEQLRYFGKLEGLSKRKTEENINYWLERFQVSSFKNKLAGELSKGQQQKVQIIATLLHNPELIILDEPFSGLDPVNSDMLSDVIQELIEEEKTIILSSHQMEQVESFCENICILRNGETVTSGKLSEIKENYGHKMLTIETSDDLSFFLNSIAVPFEKRNYVYTARVQDSHQALAIIQDVGRRNTNLKNFSLSEPSLHQIFVDKAGDE